MSSSETRRGNLSREGKHTCDGLISYATARTSAHFTWLPTRTPKKERLIALRASETFRCGKLLVWELSQKDRREKRVIAKIGWALIVIVDKDGSSRHA